MPQYEITFADGTTVTREAQQGGQAKQAATHARRQETGATEKSDARIKVASVTELTPDVLAARDKANVDEAERIAALSPHIDTAVQQARERAHAAATKGEA